MHIQIRSKLSNGAGLSLDNNGPGGDWLLDYGLYKIETKYFTHENEQCHVNVL